MFGSNSLQDFCLFFFYFLCIYKAEAIMKRIAFFDTKDYDVKSFDSVNRNFGFDIQYFDFKLTESTVDITKGFDVVCCFVNDTLNTRVLSKLKENNVGLVALRCAGFNNVEKLSEDAIPIVRVPAYSPNAVAEYAMTLIMSLNRRIHKAYSRVRNNNFNISGLTGFDLVNKTLGVIGTGKIGQILIKIARGFDMNVLAFDKYPNEKASKELGFRYVELDELYSHSDIISLHCPLTSENYHLVNEESITKMKEGIMIINTGRGQLIDTKALIRGLKSKKVGSAGLDVYEEENDYFFEDLSDSFIDDDTLSRLLTFPNVLITSHQAFLTQEALANIAETTLENVSDFVEGRELKNEVCSNGCGG